MCVCVCVFFHQHTNKFHKCWSVPFRIVYNNPVKFKVKRCKVQCSHGAGLKQDAALIRTKPNSSIITKGSKWISLRVWGFFTYSWNRRRVPFLPVYKYSLTLDSQEQPCCKQMSSLEKHKQWWTLSHARSQKYGLAFHYILSTHHELRNLVWGI